MGLLTMIRVYGLGLVRSNVSLNQPLEFNGADHMLSMTSYIIKSRIFPVALSVVGGVRIRKERGLLISDRALPHY